MERRLHIAATMRTSYAGTLVLVAALGLGCKNAEPTPSDETPTSQVADKKITADDVTRAANAAFTKLSPDQIRHDVDPEASGGNKKNWLPAEHKAGKGRWRDAAAYVDGEPVGVFWFGELPARLEPVWEEQIEGLDFVAGDTGPRERVTRVRRYRFSDFFAATGVDLSKMTEMHIYGPNNQVLVVTREDFERTKDHFYFRFGLGTSGKAIAVIPKDLGSNFDRLMGVSVYIDKKPPTQIGEDLVLDGKSVMGTVPYYGDPLRGGIRVYKDDRLVTVLKRNKMDRDLATETAGGDTSWSLLEVLKEQGVATEDIVQLEIIFDERRTERFGQQELATMTMRTSAQGRGEITVGDDTPAHALAFFTRPLPTRVATNGGADEDPL